MGPPEPRRPGRREAPGEAPASLVRELTRRSLSVATAESLTAGLIAATIARVPGSSAVLRGGLIAYATELKHELLGVPRAVLDEQGAVSQATAELMARGARLRCSADFGVAATGVAGPAEQEGHPAGTVWIAVAGAARSESRLLRLSGGRDAVREQSAAAALDLLAAVALGGNAEAHTGVTPMSADGNGRAC